MRTRTRGIRLEGGERVIDKQYRGERIFARLGSVSQDAAEQWLRDQQAAIDKRRQDEARAGPDELFRVAAAKYLLELHAEGDVRTLDTISDHVIALNEWVGELPLHQVCNDSFAGYRKARLEGKTRSGKPVRKVKPSTINRALEVARTIMNRAARVWRTADGKPWLSAAPLIELFDESQTKRPARVLSWAEQAKLMPLLPPHLERMVLFALNTGAREANICGLRWEWEQTIPEVGRSVFVVPASEFKSKRPLVIILNDVAWRIVEEQRGKHKDHVFVYRRERVKHLDQEPAMKYHPVGKINNTAFQRARDLAGVPIREHDLRHTFGHRLREAGVPKEDRALLMGHTVEGDMTQLYADASIAKLIEQANKVQETRDRMTLLRVVNG